MPETKPAWSTAAKHILPVYQTVKRPAMGQRKLILAPLSLARLLRAARPAFRHLSSWGRSWHQVQAVQRLRKRCEADLPKSAELIVAYSIRHSMATWACSKNVRDKMLAELLGHASTRTIARYQHLQLDNLRQVVENLESVRPRDCKRKDQSESP